MVFGRNGALARFQQPVSDDLKRFREYYKRTLQSGYFVIDRVVSHLCRTHGKGFRPTLTLLSARLGADRANETTIKAAVIVELLHEATLIHDDVVDESPQRRGFPSLPARFKNKVSVLFGDYMLANVLRETLSARDLRWLDILSDTARRMARGELLQAARARKLNMNEEDYLEMIGDKTASLFNACCRMGSLTVGMSDEAVDALGEYGERLGIAFQIRDDLLDIFGDGRGLGKPTGGDLREKKLTLPLLAALSRSGKREASRIRARIRRGVRRSEIEKIKEFIRIKGGEKYAVEYMTEQVNKAVEALHILPESPIRNLMEELAYFAIKRGK
ncbi:polyprenyl synthetase family protein [bacterium]|nr:polyprenyl synthetase family protein [bacterium]